MTLLMKYVYGCPIFCMHCASYPHNNYDGDGPSQGTLLPGCFKEDTLREGEWVCHEYN